MEVTLIPSPLRGNVVIPPSKSMAHRAIICASLAAGQSTLQNIAYSEDIRATIDGMRLLGANIEEKGDILRITGISSFSSPGSSTVNCRESGSTLRFLIPLFSLRGEKTFFTGQNRLLSRPQEVYGELYKEKGLIFEQSPSRIRTQGKLSSGCYTLDGNISSQFISGLLFALPLLPGDSQIHIRPPFESRSYIDLTLQAMKDFGVTASFKDPLTLVIPGNQRYQPLSSYTVEGDYSQLAFFAVLGAVGFPITCLGLRKDSLQGDRAILSFIREAGGGIQEVPSGYRFSPALLQGRTFDISDCPDLGPILMVLGAFSQGTTRLTGAGRLRYKESDRIAAMEEELRKLGADIHSTQEEVILHNTPLNRPSAPLCGHKDHRIVMSLAIAALCGGIPITLQGAEAVSKSYPSFFEDLERLGAVIKRQ